jgi:hypothetical protein
MNMSAPDLNTLLSPGQDLPPDNVMIAKALEILEQSPHGQRLAEMVTQEGIEIRIMATPRPVAYLPETRKAYIGFNRADPLSPIAFVLTLAGLLREAEQELGGIRHLPAEAPESEHLKTSLAKHEDKLWYMCTVAKELDTLEQFTKYYFLDELRKMGHDEIVDLYLKQERP